MAPRLKNNAQLADYVKVVKSCLSTFTQGYLNTDQDEVCGCYFDFLEELFTKTLRPSKELMIQALKQVHKEVSLPEITQFVDRILNVCLYLRAASRTSTTCKKLNPKIRPLVKMLQTDSKSHLSLSPSPEVCRTPKASSSSMSSTSKADRTAIFKSFGIEIPASANAQSAAVVEIVDSQPDVQYVEWFDSTNNTFKRKLQDNSIVEACLHSGPNGFLMASFKGEQPKELEVPNLVLLPVQLKVKKRPAAAKAQPLRKKPAAIASEESSDEAEVEEIPDDMGEPKSFIRYSQPYRYPNGTFAIRRAMKDTKTQVCSAKAKTMPEADLHIVMTEVSKLLNNGQLAESDIKAWLSDKVY